MNLVPVSLNEDFSHTPGPRLRRHGPYSAEEFFERHLAPSYERARERDAQLLLDLDGTAGVAATFLDELCSRLVARFGAKDVGERLLIVSQEQRELEDEIWGYIFEAAARTAPGNENGAEGEGGESGGGGINRKRF